MLKMTPCDQCRLSVAVLLCLLCLKGVTAQDVSVDSLTPPPSCPNETLIFNCQVNFPSFFIRWNHTSFEQIVFLGVATVLGSTNTPSNGQVVANLTRRTFSSSGLYMFSSTLMIHPPLKSLDLNDTIIVCLGGDTDGIRSGDTPISLYGAPSPPDDLSNGTADDVVSAKIKWNCPLYRGGGIDKYIIRIPSISYAREETGNCPMGSSHNIRADGMSGVKFNVPYVVHVTALNICGDGSEQSNITVMINAEPPQPSLSVSLMCSVGSVKADIQWQYGNSSAVYIPSTDSVTVDINPNTGTGCDHVTKETMNCSVDTTSNTTYTVVINATNSIGTNSTDMTFDSRPLLINDSGLNDSTAPHIIISMNSLCQNVEYTITVQIGVRASDNMSCMIRQNVTIMNRGRVDVDFTLNGGQEYCYTAVLSNVAGNTTPTTPTDEMKEDKKINFGLILGVCLGGFSWYVSAVSNIAVHFYWFLPVIAAGLSCTNVLLYSFGFIFSVIVFPIGLVLWMLSCCGVFSEDSDDSSHTSYSSPHNSTMTLILCCIGVMTSIIIFPFGIIVLIFYVCGHKCTAKILLTSFGIVGAVIVPPVGFFLLLTSCFCEADVEICEKSDTNTSSPKERRNYADSRWTRTVIKIGIVGSVIVFPVGIVILIYHFCCERPAKEKDEQEMRSLKSGSPDPESPVSKESGPMCQDPPKEFGPMYQDPSTIQHESHPETGQMYAMVQPGSKKNKNKKGQDAADAGPPMYQDPKTIEHEQAEGGDLYAMPQKDKKKKKKKEKDEEEIAQMYSSVDKKQKQRSEGLTYASIELQGSVKEAPKSDPATYADIKYC